MIFVAGCWLFAWLLSKFILCITIIIITVIILSWWLFLLLLLLFRASLSLILAKPFLNSPIVVYLLAHSFARLSLRCCVFSSYSILSLFRFVCYAR